jgi:hypothetical protein
MEHIVRNSLLTVTVVSCATLLSVVRIFGDAGYRESIIAQVSDPVVHSFSSTDKICTEVDEEN